MIQIVSEHIPKDEYIAVILENEFLTPNPVSIHKSIANEDKLNIYDVELAIRLEEGIEAAGAPDRAYVAGYASCTLFFDKQQKKQQSFVWIIEPHSPYSNPAIEFAIAKADKA